MQIQVLDPAKVVEDQRASGLALDARVADAFRTELTALGQARRWVLEQRVASRLTLLGATAELAEEVLRTQVSLGEVLLGPGGVVVPAPFRVVPTATSFLLIGSVPNRELMPLVPALVLDGVVRRAPLTPGLIDAVATLQGAQVEVSRWSGLDRWSDRWERWLESLQELAEQATVDEQILSQNWTECELYRGSGRWRPRGPEPTVGLYRARQPGNYWAHAWGQVSDTERHLNGLTGDEATRTRWALDASLKSPGSIIGTKVDELIQVVLSGRVPSAEYRYLVAQGARQVEKLTLSLSVAAWAEAEPLLRARLGANG